MEAGQITAIVLTAIITGGITLASIAGAWAKARSGGQAKNIAPRLDKLEQRLTRIEQAIDTVAVEVERISEAQRFNAKLLAERVGQQAGDRE